VLCLHYLCFYNISPLSPTRSLISNFTNEINVYLIIIIIIINNEEIRVVLCDDPAGVLYMVFPTPSLIQISDSLNQTSGFADLQVH